MTNSNSKIILYIAVTLLLLGGLSLFLVRGTIVTNLQTPINLPAPATFSAAADALDLKILQSPRLASLVQIVKNFDADNICFRPQSQVVKTPVVTDNTGDEAVVEEAPKSTVCALGNNLPFLSSVK